MKKEREARKAICIYAKQRIEEGESERRRGTPRAAPIGHPETGSCLGNRVLKGESSATGSEGRGEIIKAGPRGKKALTRERIEGVRGRGGSLAEGGRENGSVKESKSQDSGMRWWRRKKQIGRKGG